MARKTKIVATAGPAVENPDILREVIQAGADVIRLNFSHGTHDTHAEWVARINAVREQLGRPISLLADTKGPEIRLGDFADHSVPLEKGQTFTLTTNEVPGDDTKVSISYAGLPRDVGKGNLILLDDGLIGLRVESVSDTEIVTTVLNAGAVSSHKGINIPGVRLNLPFLSSRDRADLHFIVEHDFDYIAASFVRSAEDVKHLRDELNRLGGQHVRIIAKIENGEGVANVDGILEAADGIMVARGDMGVEIPQEDLPLVQKRLIKKCYSSGKPVITATQMLESMIQHPRPTRAEISDVANAIYDGTSAIMLSAETAAGAYPVEAVKTMARIALRAESDIDYKKRFRNREPVEETNIPDAISHATCTTAHDLGAAAIITVTQSGLTARNISKFRPECPIVSCTPVSKIWRQMGLSWGVVPLMVEEQQSTDALFSAAVQAALEAGCVSPGDLVVITAGVPLGQAGTTNLLRVHVVGEPIVQASVL